VTSRLRSILTKKRIARREHLARAHAGTDGEDGRSPVGEQSERRFQQDDSQKELFVKTRYLDVKLNYRG
jgi:hypothetical protein